jgi:hypothetical protein
MGFVAGFSASRQLGSFFSGTNQAGYSYESLREDNPMVEKALQQRLTMHFATTEFKASVKPFAKQQTVLKNSSLFAGGGVKIRMDNDDRQKTIITNGAPLWPYLKTGLTIEVGRLYVSPNIHIPLTPFYKGRMNEEFHFDLYLRIWGVNLGYRFGSK